MRNGTRKIFSPEESTHEEIQGENRDYCFLTAVASCTKNLYSPDRQVITFSTKRSGYDFEKWYSESERTLHTIGCCTTITLQLKLRFQIEKFWGRETFPYFHNLPTSQI
jgi:hypothetical protein